MNANEVTRRQLKDYTLINMQGIFMENQKAERVGFEPTVTFQPQCFSRAPRSTTPAPLRISPDVALASNDQLGKLPYKVMFIRRGGGERNVVEVRPLLRPKCQM